MNNDPISPGADRPAGFVRVQGHLAAAGHPEAPRWLEVSARTCEEAAAALGVQVGQIAKSVIFRRRADDRAVLVITSGDRRVDEAKVAAAVGPIRRADADFVKASTGFTIGGVSPVAHATPPVALFDRELLRFETVWAAAGHANGVFPAQPQDLARLADAPVVDVVVAPSTASPCVNVCRMDETTGWCQGCLRTLDEIATWTLLDEPERVAVLASLEGRRQTNTAPGRSAA